jgi:hypothetical protein
MKPCALIPIFDHGSTIEKVVSALPARAARADRRRRQRRADARALQRARRRARATPR